jgi:hypothetical protein
MKLDDLVKDVRKDEPEVDWQKVDAKVFERIGTERGSLGHEETRTLRWWAPATLTLAAAAAALLFMYPSASQSTSESLVDGHATMAVGQRIEARETSYFTAPNDSVRWMATAGSVLHVEHAASPLVLSLDQGSAEAQVTPVPSGEAFAIDVTASSGAVVRVAVHGTHLRVARDGDQVIVDLTEGVVSIGAPPRRGSLIGTLVTAPAHVSFDARDLESLHVDHAPAAVRTAEAVTQTLNGGQVAVVVPPSRGEVTPHITPARPQQPIAIKAPTTTTLTPVAPDPFLRTTDEVVAALDACARRAPNAVFSSTLTMRIGDDGLVQQQPAPLFNPPMPPEARECAANVLYKRMRLATPGDVTLPIEIK